MKRDVPRLVSNDQMTHSAKCWVIAVPTKQSVINGADNLGQKKHSQFEPDTEPLPGKAECRKAPVVIDAFSAEAGYGGLEQSSVFPLLGKPEIHQLTRPFALSEKTFPIVRNQISGSASIAKLKLFERPGKWSNYVSRKRDRGIPFGFEPVFSITLKVVPPSLHVYRRLKFD